MIVWIGGAVGVDEVFSDEEIKRLRSWPGELGRNDDSHRSLADPSVTSGNMTDEEDAILEPAHERLADVGPWRACGGIGPAETAIAAQQRTLCGEVGAEGGGSVTVW